MAEGKSDASPHAQFRGIASSESPAARHLRARTAWVTQHQPGLMGLVKRSPIWHRDYQRQEYLTSDLSTCLFASTANGARDLRLAVPGGFEARAGADPRLRSFFQAGQGSYLLSPEGTSAYAQFAQEQIPGLRVTALPSPVGLDVVIHRLNLHLPTIVFIGEGSHAIELNGVTTNGSNLVFGVVDPLKGRYETLSLQDLVGKQLGVDAQGLLRTIGLSRVR